MPSPFVRFSAREDNVIREMFAQGRTDVEIAAKLKRPSRSVCLRRKHLSLDVADVESPVRKKWGPKTAAPLDVSLLKPPRKIETPAEEALRARSRQLAEDLEKVGGESDPQTLQRETGFSPGQLPDLVAQRPEWFEGMWHKGRLLMVALTEEGRDELLRPK